MTTTTDTPRRPYVVGVFDTHSQAHEAVTDLIAAGFSAKEIGFAMRGEHEKLPEDEKAEAYGDAALSRTSTGAVTGAVLGGLLGAVSSLVIPGFGVPVLLSGILVMAAGGGIAGGFAGLMSTMELTDEEKHYYHRELEAGRCLVVVNAGDRYSEALAILETHGARDATRQAQPTVTPR